jgi:hypothetical protein
MELKYLLTGTILCAGLFIWIYAALVAGKDQPLDINARDRYKNL